MERRVPAPRNAASEAGSQTFLCSQGTMGGQVFFQDEDNNCVLPPTKANGSPCCEMKVWQPNYAGFYYDNCSAKYALHSLNYGIQLRIICMTMNVLFLLFPFVVMRGPTEGRDLHDRIHKCTVASACI